MVWFHLQNGQRLRDGGERNKSGASFSVVIRGSGAQSVQAEMRQCSAGRDGGGGWAAEGAAGIATLSHQHTHMDLMAFFLFLFFKKQTKN